MQKVATEEMLTPAGATVGTPAYMAPEQAMAQEIGPWTDLYQTGVVAYELLTGEVPYRTEGAPIAVLMKHITDPVPELPAGTNPALAAWVKRLMAKEPDERPANARVAWNELEEIVVDAEGPLWRRDARLGEHEPTVEHPTPLTPARFSSWQEYSAAADRDAATAATTAAADRRATSTTRRARSRRAAGAAAPRSRPAAAEPAAARRGVDPRPRAEPPAAGRAARVARDRPESPAPAAGPAQRVLRPRPAGRRAPATATPPPPEPDTAAGVRRAAARR